MNIFVGNLPFTATDSDLRNLFADFGSWYLLILGVIGIAVMLFAPRGLWGLFSDRTGIHLFPIRRRLTGGALASQKPEEKNG